MANLNIVELRAGSNAGIQVAKLPAVTKQAVAIGAGSVQSTAFSGDTSLIRLHPEANCTIKIGANPSAAAGDEVTLVSDQIEYFEVTPGQKLAVITR